MGYAVYEDRGAQDLGVERWAGYGIPAVCDQPGCNNAIDRGLSYRCGEMSDEGCGLSFCANHLWVARGTNQVQMCQRCCDDEEPVTPKPDTQQWEHHILMDVSWTRWRQQNPEKVVAMQERTKDYACNESCDHSADDAIED